MKKLLTKLTLGFITFLVIFLSFAPNLALAQNANWWELDFATFADKISTDTNTGGSPANEIFGERYTYAQVSWIISSLISIIGGPVADCAASAGSQEEIAACLTVVLTGDGGVGPVLALAAGVDGLQNTKAVSGIDYVALKLQDLNLVSEANAQGFGFSNSLEPIQRLWSVARNAAYALSTLVILILAFMIMFRTKLNPQTSITIQSALPKLIIALIFITFSYAIAGFLVDLAFVVQGIIATLVSTGKIVGDAPFDVFQQMNDGVGNVLAYGIVFILDSLDGGVLANAINLGFLNAVKFMLGPIDTILALVILLLLLIGLARIFWLLILTYAKFIFLVIASPFVGLASVISSVGISGWIKSIVAQLSVFVSISVLILFAHIFYYGFGNNIGDSIITSVVQATGVQLDPFGADVVPDLAGDGSGVFPSGFSFGDNLRGLGFFLSLVVMLSVPKLASSVRDQIQMGKATWGHGLGEAMAPINKVGTAGLGFGSAMEKGMWQTANAPGMTPTNPQRTAHTVMEIMRSLGKVR